MTETPPPPPTPPPPTPPPPTPPPPTPPQEPDPRWSLRRTGRTPGADSWEIRAGDGEPLGRVFLNYADHGVEGVLATAGEVAEDKQRSVLVWLTDTLGLDAAAGPAGLIHWNVVSGEVTEFWRRSPGRRVTGVDSDLASVRARVEAVLGSVFGAYGTTPDGDLAVDVGSVRVFVAIRLVETTVAVRVFCITNLELPPGAEAAAFLLSLNFGMVVGRFSIDPSARAVWFDHVLAAGELDEGTLGRVVSAVAATADRYDDEIKARFGGRTFREEGSPVELTVQADMAGGYL